MTEIPAAGTRATARHAVPVVATTGDPRTLVETLAATAEGGHPDTFARTPEALAAK